MKTIYRYTGLFIGLLFVLVLFVPVPVLALSFEDQVQFDFFNPESIRLLAIFLITGVGASFAFMIVFHLAVQNWDFAKRDLFFAAAGPGVAIIGAILGYKQWEIIQWTFTVNLSVSGLKDAAKKIFGFAKEREEENTDSMLPLSPAENQTSKSEPEAEEKEDTGKQVMSY